MKLPSFFGFIKSNKKTVNATQKQGAVDLPNIATDTWIDTYFKVFFTPSSENWTKQTSETYMANIRLNIANNILRNYPLHRIANVKSSIVNKKVEFLIRFRERSIQELRDPTYGLLLDPIFGYSPIDFILDKQKFVELDKALCEQFGIPYIFLPVTTGKFNKQGEPIIEFRVKTFFTSHRVIDELELYSKCPEIAESCFPNKGIVNFIKLDETRIKQDKKWLRAVDNLLDKYF
ncbi:MAG: hypothetical protein LVQ97_02880 [Candidatus Micrarchaeales archaeon]|jgi:hypothetical protein|uniref:Uncharacterized protein n=1 Tax=Candidatus Micrarchaeum acidiphilum ARMAN-2 TaxID=425595 RepID=C7DGF5_MICA2|nr:MAG: hypothetical protein UNLARM2_0162 [Candidatus Micrarchaeum acidiphilum ARMAN-2]MCW6161104.1 hypothetical protein [Candidatus Micrarchaeales archaeon]